MPAPLGKVPTKKMPNIQVFGLEDNNATRAALRFFRERRIVVHFVDLRKKPIAAGELRDIGQARELIARSFPTVTYEPSGDWSEARARYAAMQAARSRA